MQWPVDALRWRGARPSRERRLCGFEIWAFWLLSNILEYSRHFCSGRGAPRVTVFRSRSRVGVAYGFTLVFRRSGRGSRVPRGVPPWGVWPPLGHVGVGTERLEPLGETHSAL
eukprot:4827900-Prymnesium_polylepis.1